MSRLVGGKYFIKLKKRSPRFALKIVERTITPAERDHIPLRVRITFTL